MKVNKWEAVLAIAIDAPEEDWDCMDLIGVEGPPDGLLRLGDTFGGLVLWEALPDGRFKLRCMTVQCGKPAQYKIVDLAFLRKSIDRKQNFAGTVVGVYREERK